jgi:ABC-type antimicrobial peptide transport system permease subunit
VGLGIVLGLALSFGLDQMIAQWIENGARDPFVVLGVSAVLLAVAGVASLVPARRALAINPIEALRSE